MIVDCGTPQIERDYFVKWIKKAFKKCMKRKYSPSGKTRANQLSEATLLLIQFLKKEIIHLCWKLVEAHTKPGYSRSTDRTSLGKEKIPLRDYIWKQKKSWKEKLFLFKSNKWFVVCRAKSSQKDSTKEKWKLAKLFFFLVAQFFPALFNLSSSH